MNFELNGKVAVITGAGGVICGVMAQELARQGVKIALLDIQEDHAQAVARQIQKEGGEAMVCQADVLDPGSLDRARQAVLERFGTLDILINGAGGNKKQATTGAGLDFFSLDPKAIQWVFDLNVTGAVLTTQAFGRELVNKGTGSVINIASMASYLPLTNTVAYSGAKAAVANFTQWMAVHFNQNYSTCIRVNAIAPGFLLTEQNRFLLTQENGAATERGEKVIAKTPMGRYGRPEELCGAVMWLCSEAASFVNGAVIPVDGGFSAYWGV